ncbi:hypothetical protein PXH67_19120 [Streptomyces sp. P8-A8]|uniref:hypothetical protein n=1 Tax=unclassified Streptomyces TaxID=2593676 RepID=UPI001F156807|nr:hypothetical protein [Streptomyces sp. ADI95-17]
MSMVRNPTTKVTIKRTLIGIAVTVVTLGALVALFVPFGGRGTDAANGDGRHGNSAPGGHDQDHDRVDLARRITDFTRDTVAHSDYLPPLRAQRRTAAEAVGLFLDGRRAEAGRRLDDIDFGIRTYTDTATGRRFAEISDRAAEGRRGWGRVYIDLSATSRWSVQVPHPVADSGSEQLGIGVLRARRGGVLVMAGAHRNADKKGRADVAHRRDTVFDAVCDELAARRFPGLQVHGFADSTEPDYDVIASLGSADKGLPTARRAATALRHEGFAVCRAWARRCALEGRGNVQGREAEDQGVPFLHMEFSRTVRDDAARVRRASAAMAAALPS